MEEANNLKSISTKSTKNRMSNGWSMLASAILKSAVRDGDVEFFSNEWCETIHEIANINGNIPLGKLKEIAHEIRNEKYMQLKGE